MSNAASKVGEVMDPILKELVVEAPQERAFRVFTEHLDLWWPKEHHIGKAEFKDAKMEPRANGRWYEIGVDGSTCDWGKVLAWEPPRRVILSWQINAQWQFDPSLVTEVEVTFTPEGPKRTRVALIHRNLERFGEGAEQLRAVLAQGWEATLELFGKASAAYVER